MEGDLRLSSVNFSRRLAKALLTTILLIILPIYLYFGMQPASSLDYTDYPTLSIPAINLKTPVSNIELANHQLEAPATIAGAYLHSPHKIFIIGHSSTVFRDLHQLQIGDLLYYDQRKFLVKNIVTEPKNEVDMSEILSPALSDTIVIMTCAGDSLPNQDATHRLIITAEPYPET